MVIWAKCFIGIFHLTSFLAAFFVLLNCHNRQISIGEIVLLILCVAYFSFYWNFSFFTLLYFILLSLPLSHSPCQSLSLSLSPSFIFFVSLSPPLSPIVIALISLAWVKHIRFHQSIANISQLTPFVCSHKIMENFA